jgi:hypothetical protein
LCLILLDRSTVEARESPLVVAAAKYGAALARISRAAPDLRGHPA